MPEFDVQKKTGIKTIAAFVTAGMFPVLSVLAGPNLTPYQPSGWSDKIVVTRTNGGVIDSPNLLSTDTLYADWAIINSGNAPASIPFVVAFYIDGVSNQSFSITSLSQNHYEYFTGIYLGSLSPGSHTISIVADATHVETGDNESDNSYTKTISVSAVVLPAPALLTPGGGASGQAVVPAFTWSAVSNAAAFRILLATNAADLPSSTTASSGGSSVVINAVTPTNSFSPTVQLTPSVTYYWEVHAVEQNDEDGTWSSAQSFTTGPIPAGLTIIPTFDSTITSDPNAATIEATINAAISVYRENFSDPITVTVTYTEMSDGLGLNDTYYNNYSYAAYRAALVNHATTADDTNALAYLPASTANPVNGNTQMYLNLPLARALGLGNSSLPVGTNDSIVYLNTSIMNLSSATTDPNKYSLFATVCHETDEAIGFGSALNGLANGESAPTGPVEPEDLFRYDQNGNRSLTTSLNATSFFSLDGTKDLAQFNQYDGGDFGDWYSYDVTITPQVQDAFAPPGANPILAVELRGLDVIGYQRVLPSGPAAAVLGNLAVSGGNFNLTVTGTSGASYVVQYSSDLATWSPIATNAIPGSGATNISIAIGANPHRFYRAVSQ